MALYINVDASRSANSNDFEKILVCSSTSAIVITITQDTLLGTSTPQSTTIALYQASTGVPTFAAGVGVTILGTQPPAFQNGFYGITRVASNTWAWM